MYEANMNVFIDLNSKQDDFQIRYENPHIKQRGCSGLRMK